MHAYDAVNGRELWTWAIVPAARAARRQHLVRQRTATTAAARCGSRPIVDTKLNLAIFGTGNPVPWNSRGPGKNLYTDSIVALNLYTGQLVWGYQTAHHDLWDSDLPNNGVVFDAQVQGPGHGQGEDQVPRQGATASS